MKKVTAQELLAMIGDGAEIERAPGPAHLLNILGGAVSSVTDGITKSIGDSVTQDFKTLAMGLVSRLDELEQALAAQISANKPETAAPVDLSPVMAAMANLKVDLEPVLAEIRTLKATPPAKVSAPKAQWRFDIHRDRDGLIDVVEAR